MGEQGNSESQMPRISPSGRFVTFASRSGFGLAIDGQSHIFVRDLRDESLTWVSKPPTDLVENGDCFNPVISADGRFVAFMSWASNLHVLDTNGTADVYCHDRQSGKTYLVSATPTGSGGDDISSDPEITADGRFVVFRSQATDLVAGDTNDAEDLFRRDLRLEVTNLVTVDAGGIQASAYSTFGAISDDGRYVAFQSRADNLTVAEGDVADDIFVKDMLTGTVELISVRHDGTSTNSQCTSPSISADGTRIAFLTNDSQMVPGPPSAHRNLFVFDRTTGVLTCASLTASNGNANGPVISGRLARDGGHVAFSNAANLIVPFDTNNLADAFVRDLAVGTTKICSVSTPWPTVPCGGEAPDVSSGGVFVVFTSDSSQLVVGDNNATGDVFVRDHTPWLPYSYCRAKLNSLGCVPSSVASGLSSATAASGFVLSAINVLNGRPGLMLYSIAGKAMIPFQGGTLCLASPIRRAPGGSSGGTPPPAVDCSGVLSIDFNRYAIGLLGGNPILELQIPGTRVCTQWWSRDPGFPAPQASSLSDAQSFVVLP